MEGGAVEFAGSGDGFGSVCADGARSECLKQERSTFYGDFWRASKLAKTEAQDFSLDASTLPYFHHMEATHCRNSGSYSCGGLDTSSGVYLVSGVRGPFTPSQWLELEQQALIYKYIISNVPIPLHLLIPIRRAFESAGFYGFNSATHKSTSWGWDPLHLGYPNSTDPEPGRCRRTDGKKWRCARDAVANQKYCEKHMNRGRHRSRKHVEGHSVSGGATTTKPMTAVPSVLPGGGSSNGLDIHQHQHFQGKSFNSTSSLNSGQALQDAAQLSYLSQGMSLNGFRAPSSESLSNVASQNHYSPYAYIFNDRRGGALQSQSESIQLSMSIPTGPTDFMSSTSSPINDKADVSPLRVSQEDETGLGFGSKFQSPIQANWKPISWEASMGGPLAEALQSSSNSTDLPKEWDGSGSYQLSSPSPTGVVQKSALVSLSNSSGGSSP